MSCLKPIKVYDRLDGSFDFSDHPRSVVVDSEGKPSVSYLPCGKCLGCRLDYARDWAVRCKHELLFHDQACFVTLTFDDDHLPKKGVEKSDLQDFFKRLRSRLAYNNHDPPALSYLACGEYGSRTFRPHYHAIIFGWCPSDCKYFFTDSGSKSNVYKSDELQSLWKFGFVTVGLDVSYECCNYVARYVVKKQTQEEISDVFFEKNNKPFLLSSRRPALGRRYLERYSEEVLRSGEVIVPGRFRSKVPRYYEKYAEEKNPEKWLKVKKRRRKIMKSRFKSETDMYDQLSVKSVYLTERTKKIMKGCNTNV